MSLHEDISALKSRLQAAELERTRAEGAREHAQQVVAAARDDLHREFGVDSSAEAEELLEQLRVQLDRQIARINAQLDEIGVA